MSSPPRVPPGFSTRLAWPGVENALAAAEAHRRAQGGTLLDLTVSNPTAVGLLDSDDAASIAAALGRKTAHYAPTPRGDRQARRAIADAYADAGTSVDPDRIVLTASSSESYAYLLKLLCDAGDSVLVPEPSYPLFDYLARLEGVVTAPYRLDHDGTASGRWSVEWDSVDAALAGTRGETTDRAGSARAIVIVSPNNPTGSILRAGDLEALDARATRAGLSLVADEVFADYVEPQAATGAGAARPVRTIATEDTAALTFSLGGLSKSCGMPHLKVGWLLAGGPAAAVEGALGRLELIADTYLSVSGPVQAALPELLQTGARIRRRIADRVARNRRQLAARTGAGTGSPLTVLQAEGGWTAIVRVPAVYTDEAWALTLLQQDGVLVHPGYFFDLRGATFLVVSLLTEPAVFDEGLARLAARAGLALDPAISR